MVNNSLETSSYKCDSPEKSFDRSISVFNKDPAGATTTFPYIQYELGLTGTSNLFLDTSDNGLFPGYDYQVELTVRDSDFQEQSQVGVCLFVDDFYGQTYYFDFEDQKWKHKDELILIKRKTNPIYDFTKIYATSKVKDGEFLDSRDTKVFDPKKGVFYYSTNTRKVSFKFHTSNFDTVEPKSVRGHARRHGGLHSVKTRYYFRAVKYSNEGAFVSFDDISIRNLTYEKLANDYYLEKEDPSRYL